MDLKAKRPNHLLRYARQEHGWSQQRLAEQIGTTEDVISRWERGTRMPGPYYRERLCLLFQKSARDLGFVRLSPVENYLAGSVPVSNASEKRSSMANLEHFAFGMLQSTWIVVDGDGMFRYAPQHILTHVEPEIELLPPDLLVRKQVIARQQAEQKAHGRPFHWNGQRYSLNRFVVSRSELEEDLALDLWFTPTDYYTFLATNMSLDDASLREQYLKDADWSQPVPFFSHSFGIYLLVITSDNKVLFTSRSMGVGSRPGQYNVSVCEGLSTIDASGQANLSPHVYGCAERGLTEELGLLPEDTRDKIHFLSFGVDTWYAQWGLLGMIRTPQMAQEIMRYRQSGVKDRLENAQIYLVNFTLDEVVTFVLERQPWTPGGLACLYHTLVHEFGRPAVEKALYRQINCE
jgi:transcriptional regulator with XRE-family HTH domain